MAEFGKRFTLSARTVDSLSSIDEPGLTITAVHRATGKNVSFSYGAGEDESGQVALVITCPHAYSSIIVRCNGGEYQESQQIALLPGGTIHGQPLGTQASKVVESLIGQVWDQAASKAAFVTNSVFLEVTQHSGLRICRYVELRGGGRGWIEATNSAQLVPAAIQHLEGAGADTRQPGHYALPPGLSNLARWQ